MANKSTVYPGSHTADRWVALELREEWAQAESDCGRIPDTRAIEKEVTETLDRVDAKDRAKKPRPQPSADRASLVERQAAEKGMRLVRGAPAKPMRLPPPEKISHRAKALNFRIRQCVEQDLTAPLWSPLTERFKHPRKIWEPVIRLYGLLADLKRSGYSKSDRDRIADAAAQNHADRTNLYFRCDWRDWRLP